MEQNVKAMYKGKEITVQFDFCPKCKFYLGCYDGGHPNYISPECLEEHEPKGNEVDG